MRRFRPSLCVLALLAIVLACAPAATSATAAQPVSIAVEDFGYLDTSGEPVDQRVVHQRRLQDFMAALRHDLEAERRYQLVPSAQSDTTFRIAGGVQKTSTLVQWARVALIDVAANKVLAERLYTFRGDNDEAWRHAESFVSREILAALAAASDRPTRIPLAVFDFELEDTTAAAATGLAPSDAARLAEVTQAVREVLERSGRYHLVDVSRADSDAVRARTLRDCGGCEAAISESLGADQSLIGVVRRVSRTEYTIGFLARDSRSGAVVASGDSGLRMGADYSWTRGAARLVSDRLVEGQSPR